MTPEWVEPVQLLVIVCHSNCAANGLIELLKLEIKFTFEEEAKQEDIQLTFGSLTVVT